MFDSTVSIICLLDDDPAVLKGISRLLSSADCQVRQFCDPIDFLLYAKRYRPPLAIVDVWMPSMNGLEVQSQLQQVSPSTRVIIFTGKDDVAVREAALKAGAWAFFIKPFNDEVFLASVRTGLAGMDETP